MFLGQNNDLKQGDKDFHSNRLTHIFINFKGVGTRLSKLTLSSTYFTFFYEQPTNQQCLQKPHHTHSVVYLS